MKIIENIIGALFVAVVFTATFLFVTMLKVLPWAVGFIVIIWLLRYMALI